MLRACSLFFFPSLRFAPPKPASAGLPPHAECNHPPKEGSAPAPTQAALATPETSPRIRPDFIQDLLADFSNEELDLSDLTVF